MPPSRIPSPARSQGAKHTPRRHKPRFSRSVGSPARSDTSVKLSAVVQMDSFVLSPMPTRKSVLTDTTDIDIPRRKSWWKKLDENSREIMDVINAKEAPEANNAIEEYIDVDVLSQEKKNYTLDLPESSDGESISSIIIPQRKLFTQKESQNQNKFAQIIDTRETLGKLHKSQAIDERELNVGPKNLFNQGKKQKSKPIFPSALLNISANKTLGNKTKEIPPNEAKGQVKSLFGNRPGTKRKNMFADFIVSESEDEISEIQPKVFGFQKKLAQNNIKSRGVREPSPTSSMTDIEMDDWRLLPSSTMVDHQLEDGLRTTPSKRARLSKLSEAVESVNTTANKTKQSNKTLNSKSRSKNASKFNEMEEHELISPINDDDLDAVADNQNRSINKSLPKTDENSKNISHEKSLKKETSKHSKSKNASHMKTVNEEVVPEDIVNNEEIKSNEGNKNNKSTQNKTSSTLTKIDQALQSDDDDDFTLEYENDDEAVGDVESNKTIVENVAENLHQSIENVKSSKSENLNISKGMQNITKNQSDIRENPQMNKNEVPMNKEDVIGSHKRITISDEVDTHENNKNSNRDVSRNKSLRIQNMSKNTSSSAKHQEDNVELNEMEVEKTLVDCQVESSKAKDGKRNISESNKINEYEKENQHEDSNKEDDKNDEMSDKDQTTSPEIEDDEQNDPECDEDEEEQQDEAQNSQELQNAIEDEEIMDNDKSNSHSVDNEEEVDGNEDMEDENEGKESENEEIEDQDEEMENQDEESEGGNDGMEDENEEIVEDNDDDESANVTAVDNDDESQEADNEDIQEVVDDNGEEDGDVDNDTQVNDESQENDEDEEEEEMQESDQNVSQEVESEDEVQDDQDASEAENDEPEAENDEQEAENDEQEIEDSDQNVSLNDKENVSRNDQEDEEIEHHDDEETNEESHEEEMEQSDVQNESDEEIEDDNVNESEDEVDNHDESAEEDERDTADIEANETHDTTGRHRHHEQRVPSPEAILHDKTNAMESFTVQGRNTSVRKTKSMIRKNRSPSLAPVRESTGLSDGVRDSSGEGSGWDSHRTTRLTIRQTIGRDFTPRKSLRALVMEKSAKRNTNFTDTNTDMKMPQANSTELPRQESFDEDNQDDEFDEEMPSDHEESRRMRQTTLEMYLQKVKEKNIERKKQLEDEIRSSLKAPTRDMLNPFKVPAIPKRTVRRTKPLSKANTKLKSAIPLNLLPAEVLEDMKYKPPKRYQPANASWITKRLYKFLETKLEPKYDYKARVRSEKLVETLYNFTKDIRRLAVAPPPAVDALRREMARLDVVNTHVEFYEFFHEYMPREVRVKVVPDVFNKISLPKHGVFSNILR